MKFIIFNNDSISLASTSRLDMSKSYIRGRSMPSMKSNRSQSNLRLPNKSITKNNDKVILELQKLFGDKLQLSEDIYQNLTEVDKKNCINFLLEAVKEMNNTNKILDYFIKKQNLVMYLKPKIHLSFSIVDQQWALPYKIKYYEISEDLIDDIFGGNRYFNFTVDLNDIIKNEVGAGPFLTKDFPYPYFEKGDIYFYEINMEDKEKQLIFYPFRGEIKK